MKNFFKWLQPRMTITLFLRHGHQVVVKCTEYNIKFGPGGQITSYSFQGMRNTDQLVTVNIEDIIAITRKG